MPWSRLICRSLVALAHATWLGGFTLYGAVVIPILHEEFGSLEGGMITQRVSDRLNLIGLATLAGWWPLAWSERRDGPCLARRIRFALLSCTTLILGFLAVDHEILDDRIARFGLTGFYRYHRIYLIASSLQWAANIGLVPATLSIWSAAVPGATQAADSGVTLRP